MASSPLTRQFTQGTQKGLGITTRSFHRRQHWESRVSRSQSCRNTQNFSYGHVSYKSPRRIIGCIIHKLIWQIFAQSISLSCEHDFQKCCIWMSNCMCFFLLTLDTLSLRKSMRWGPRREMKDNKSGEWRKLAESFNTPACKTNQLKCYSISSHRSREDSLISVWKTDHWGRYHVNVVIINTTHNHVNSMWWWHVDSDREQLLVLIKLWTLNH